jgi:hypothetical protein
MVNNFSDFILEKQMVSLILENDLNASPEFLSRLDKIKDKSKVAQILYLIFREEYYISKDLPQNWIDVTNDPEIVSFLSDQRARRTPMQFVDDYSEYYEAPGRGQMKVGRFAQALLNDPEVREDLEMFCKTMSKFRTSDLNINLEDLLPKDYEDFVNLYKSEFVVVSNEFKLVSGEEIPYYYDFMNYAYPDQGQLGSSCMRYTPCQKYFGIYKENPDVCKLLVYVNQENKVLGRALVWKLEKKVDGCPAEYFMDRVYCAKDSDMIKFKNYAKEQGWVMKNKNTSDLVEMLFFNYNDQVFLSHVYVQLGKFDFTKFPFIDTLTFLHPVSGRLHNVKGKNTLELSSTGGDSYENEDNEPRSQSFKQLLKDTLDDRDYSRYHELIKVYLQKLSS